MLSNQELDTKKYPRTMRVYALIDETNDTLPSLYMNRYDAQSDLNISNHILKNKNLKIVQMPLRVQAEAIYKPAKNVVVREYTHE